MTTSFTKTTRFRILVFATAVLAVLAIPATVFALVPGIHAAAVKPFTFNATGGLDCNGFSSIQKRIRTTDDCTDLQGYDGARGADNGHYVGHDEPSVQFNSSKPGSGNNVEWQISLPQERGSKASKTFENQIAFWFSMALCDPNSYPQQPCIPDSDKNHSGPSDPKSAGSAFLEMQFYAPGFAPFISQISCDQTHWCASLHINSAECTLNFAFCNPACTEPTNFAFIQMDGIPTGPPGPASQTNASFTPNNETLLMNQGDKLAISIHDTTDGLFTGIHDISSGQSGFMVASATNGFQSLNVNTCAPTNFSFHPEFSTAKFGNFLPWAALQANVGFAVETGHFEVGPNGDGDSDDAPCFTSPTPGGCVGADLDFDGTSYIPDWPDGTQNTPTSLHIGSVLSGGFGPVSAPFGSTNYTSSYPSLQFETDVLASESSCTPTGAGCTVPPAGAVFYPFYAQNVHGSACYLSFGNDLRNFTTNDFGRDAQYGTSNIIWFFGTASGGLRPNPCPGH